MCYMYAPCKDLEKMVDIEHVKRTKIEEKNMFALIIGIFFQLYLRNYPYLQLTMEDFKSEYTLAHNKFHITGIYYT